MMAGAGTAKTNWVAIWISAAVVVLLVVVGGLVVWMNNQATAPAESPGAASIDQTTGAITIGDADDVLETYVDFMCPYCGQFEDSWGETVSEQVAAGELSLKVYPVAILDHLSQGTEFSTRAANAMYCVAETEPDAAYPFLNSMFRDQPSESTPGLSDEEIIAHAERVGAGAAADCITERPYDDFVAQVTEAIPADEQGRRSTPTVLLNGETVNWQLPAEQVLPGLQG